MKNKISEGRTLDYTVADADIASGQLVVINDIAGVAVTGGAVGETVAIAIEGVYALPKAAGNILQGKKVYFNATDKNIVATSTGNTFIGYAWEAATASDTYINVKLSF